MRRFCDAKLERNSVSYYNRDMEKQNIELHLLEGEGLKVEFKERLTSLDREIVAFANAAGGVVYLGVNDQGEPVGIPLTNKLKSQVTDIARNCDPSITIKISEYPEQNILAISVAQGPNRPYRCRDGFFLRIGPNSQKLKRDEILDLVQQSRTMRFDEAICESFRFPEDFSSEALNNYLKICGVKTVADERDILVSLNVAEEEGQRLKMTNAGVLFFAKDPQHFFPESYLTAVKYETTDRYSILDKKDFIGPPIQQVEETLAFVTRHMNVQMQISSNHSGALGRRKEAYDYSIVALREAVVNSVAHRDYLFDSTHSYLHMFSNRLELENPGGLPRGLTEEGLGKRSVRRNRLIADLLHRAGYIERVGSGFDRMRRALQENQNPPLQVSATNFFTIQFSPRLKEPAEMGLTERQRKLLGMLQERKSIQTTDAIRFLGASKDTVLRELNTLIRLGLVEKHGKGRGVTYHG